MNTHSWIRQLFTRPAARPIRKAPHRFRPVLADAHAHQLRVHPARCVVKLLIVRRNAPTGYGIRTRLNGPLGPAMSLKVEQLETRP